MSRSITLKGKFRGHQLKLNVSSYRTNNQLAIELATKRNDAYLIASICLVDEKLADDEVAIKNYSENEGVLDFLISEGIISNPLRYLANGFVVIPICKFLK